VSISQDAEEVAMCCLCGHAQICEALCAATGRILHRHWASSCCRRQLPVLHQVLLLLLDQLHQWCKGVRAAGHGCVRSVSQLESLFAPATWVPLPPVAE
jgi:hypothetical protein